jgi:hypothetical protein
LAVEYSAHAEQKLYVRRITKQDVERTIIESKQRYTDVENNAEVAVGPVNARYLVVVYRVANADIKVMTVYHARKLEKLLSSKIRRGAWRKVP